MLWQRMVFKRRRRRCLNRFIRTQLVELKCFHPFCVPVPTWKLMESNGRCPKREKMTAFFPLLKLLCIVSLTAILGDITRAAPHPHGDCYCTREYRPVCGWDGRNYPTRCVARCQSVSRTQLCDRLYLFKKSRTFSGVRQ